MKTLKIFAGLLLLVAVSIHVAENVSLTHYPEVNEGNTLILTCEGHSNSPARLTWTVNGREVRNVTDNLDHYVILNASCSDSATYTCAASNADLPGLVRSVSLQLRVRCSNEAAKNKSNWFEVHESADAKVGQGHQLTCYLVGKTHASINSTSSFEWRKNDEVLPKETGRVLNLTNVTSRDAAYYQCGPKHDSMNMPRFFLHVPGGVLPMPDIIQQGIPIAGRPFALNCSVLKNYINSRTRYTWYKDHVQIAGQSAILLRFASLQEQDVGEYVCTASEGPVERTSPLSRPYHLTPLVPPVVHMEPKSPNSVVKGILGNNLTLTCNVTKAIPPVPEYAYNWSYLSSSAEMSRPLVGNARTLTLGPLTRKNNGQYICTASSGEYFKDPLDLRVNASVMVKVVYLEKASLISPEEIEEGDLVTLTCQVDSHPLARLTWTVNGREVRHVTDNLDHYVILNVSCSDSANYTCTASNADLPGLVRSASLQLHVRCHTDRSTARNTTINIAAVLPVLIIVVFLILTVIYCRRRGRKAAWLRSVRRKLRRMNPRRSDSRENNVEDNVPLLLISRNTNDFKEGKKSKFEGAKLALLQGQRIQFDKTYRNGVVYVLPPLPQPQQAEQDEVIAEESVERKLKEEMVKLLYEDLQKITGPEDPPAFIFSQALSDSKSVIIYHSTKGVVIVHVDSETSSTFRRATQLLKEMRDKTIKELEGLLEPSAVTLLLVLPNVTDTRSSRNIFRDLLARCTGAPQQLSTFLCNPDIHVLKGRTAGDYEKWLRDRPDDANVWRSNPERRSSFEMAVSRYLSVECFRDTRTWAELPPEVPSGWLVTPEQAGVLHREDRLLHLHGPPGSGKTMLLVDRARRWLRQGKHVIVAVGDTRLELLLDTLDRWVLHGDTCNKAHKLTLCLGAEKFKKAVQDVREGQKQPEICAILDEASMYFLSSALDVLKSKDISCLWAAGDTDLTDQEALRFQELKGQSVFLEHSVRCPPKLVELANLLETGTPPPRMSAHPAILDLDTPPVPAVLHKTQSHCAVFAIPSFHSDPGDARSSSLRPFVCTDCEEWLKSSMSPLVNRLSMEDEQWRRWVILLTGGWDYELIKRLVEWLQRQGVPAVLEWQPDNETSIFSRDNRLSLKRDQKFTTNSYTTVIRARVASGKDVYGRPAVHVMHVSHCQGLERPCVLVVHYDKDDHRDSHRDHNRKIRLSRHRAQLFRVVTSCQQELCVCFLSPSPAARLLPQLR